MNRQMPGQQQANFQNQPFQQPQNGSQQRPMANGPQKATQDQQYPQSSSIKYDPPKLAFFTLEKPRHVEGWDDVRPERQHIAYQDLQTELAKFKRNQGSVKRALDEISSPSCRRLINDLVKEETDKLWEHNKSLQYTIAAVMNVSRWVDERKKRQELKRVQVILETERSGFPEPQNLKAAAGGGGMGGINIQGGQDMNKGMKANGQNMSQQPKNLPQQGNNMGQNQHFEQRPPGPQGGGPMHGGGGAPPPPPPPPGGGGHHNQPPPPPPPGHPGAHLPPPPPGAHHPHSNSMPGAFPGAMPMPGMRHGQPPIQVLDPRFAHNGKSKKGRREEESSESSSEWDTESGSSGSEPIHVRNVEHGAYGLVGKKDSRGRSKRSKGSKKSRRHRSQSQGLSRSRSHSRGPHRSSHRRRDSDLIDPRGRHSPNSSGPNSPKLPPIHIHMNNNSSGDEKTHSHRKRRERRGSHQEFPPATYNKRVYEHKSSSHPMARGGSKDSRDSWQSFGQGSESSSATSSIRAGEDNLFDAVRRSRRHHRSTSYSRPHHGSFTPPRTVNYTGYDDLNRREHVRNVHVDDYPHSASPPRGRNTYYKEPILSSRPPLHRYNTIQGHRPNPFEPSGASIHRDSMQSHAYPVDMHQAKMYPLPQHVRYSPETSPVDRDRFEMDDLADALLDHMEKKKHRVPLVRRHTERMDHGSFNGDEWDHDPRYQSSRGRTYGTGYGR